MNKCLSINTLILLLCLTACKNKLPETAIYKGRYIVTQLRNSQQTIAFDLSDKYQLEINNEGRFYVKAEDNVLSAQYQITKDSILLADMVQTDVCCNSNKANQLFSFFDAALRWQTNGDTVLLHSTAAQLQLVFVKN